jgi:hypothetical protein
MAETAERNFSQEAREVFDYWKQVTKHQRSRMDDKRQKIIVARLKDGYSVDDLKLASFGCAHSRFHQGENERHTVFDSVELIYRGADKVDQFIRHGELEVWRRQEAKRAEEARREETLKASVPGDGYRTARAQILSIVKKKAA